MKKKRNKNIKNDISKKENMKYLEDEDSYACANGRKLEFAYTAIRKNSIQYKSEYKVCESSNFNECKLSDCLY